MLSRALVVTAVGIALALAAFLLFPAPADAQSPGFPDVDLALPAHDAVVFLSEAGIISGYQDGTFGPGDTLKRGQATKMLALWQAVPMVTGENSFPDLDDVYRDYVETAYAQGWITGFPDGRFKPYSTLTRQQMAIIMVRAMGWEDVAAQLSGPEVDEVLSAFSDQAGISDVARPYVAVAVSEGLFGGDGEGRFNPKSGITRAQFCLVVFRGELSIRSVVQGVRSASDYPDKTRVVIDLSRAPDSVTVSGTADGILAIDYTGGVVAEALSQPIEGSAEVTRVGAAQIAYDPRTVRLTLDLGRYQTFRVMSLAPSEDKGYRIAVDIYRRVTGPLEDGPPLICVDPGHGGEDSGAVGVAGTKEKDINLAMSLLVVANLRAAGLGVMMTRRDDSFVDKYDRPPLANVAFASLFVSVHNNAMGSASATDVSGTETYYWGTSDGYSVEGGLLAEAIQRNLIEALGSVDRGVKTAGFVVLAGTEMAAALVEVGFLTNAAEEAKLVTAAYQQAAAQGITNGILEYPQVVDAGILYGVMKNDRALFPRREPLQVTGQRARPQRMLGLFATVIAVVLLAGMILAPVAQAASSFVFVGRGNGHGVGMSQWGAWYAAREEGKTFAQILAFYYPGTTLEAVDDPDTVLKVRVSSTPWTSNTTIFSQVDLKPTVTSGTLRKYASNSDSDFTTQTISAGTLVRVQNSGGKVRVTVGGTSAGTFARVDLDPDGSGASEGRNNIQLRTSGGTTIDYREYWGTIRVQPGEDSGELWVYNFVALEKYVSSIAEVDYDWATIGGVAYAPEAVKAQAVASRTYAVAKNGTLADNWADQCYRGYSFEAKYPGIAQAAQATAGQILTYQGKPITAFFSGHSGGYTTVSAWSGDNSLPYIVAQPDPWSRGAPPSSMHSQGPGWNWTYTVSADNLSKKVNGNLKDTSGRTVNVGRITSVDIAARDTSDATSHARTLLLSGANGTAKVSALSFRSLVGTSNLPSTLVLTVNGDAGTAGTGEPWTGGDTGGDDTGGGGTSDDDTGGTGGGPLLPGEFYDVGLDHLYHDQISRVVVAELMGGYEDGLFKPDGTVTRAQFAKIAVSLYNLMHVGDQIIVVNVTTKPFDDVAIDSKTTGDTSDWIAAAKKAGLVSGTSSNSFSPFAEIQRDQMATMICRALGWDDEAAALSTDTPGFSDVPSTSSHWAGATYLKQQGILMGYGEPDESGGSVLGAQESIKRQHVAVILCRVLDLEQ